MIELIKPCTHSDKMKHSTVQETGKKNAIQYCLGCGKTRLINLHNPQAYQFNQWEMDKPLTLWRD